MKYIKKMQEQRQEGEVNKRQAIEAIEKENEAKAKRRAKRIQVLQDTRKLNEHLQKLKAIELEKEKEEERKIEEYGRKKQAMIDMRKRREEERFREK